MKLKRTIYADRDEMVSRLQVERVQAQADAALTYIPRYKREYWRGRAEGLDLAIGMLRDWAGEEEPEEDADDLAVRRAENRTQEELDEIRSETDPEGY
jgi:hypothetical protein